MSIVDEFVKRINSPRRHRDAEKFISEVERLFSVPSVTPWLNQAFHNIVTFKLTSALVLMVAACGGPHVPTAEHLMSHTTENRSVAGPHLGQEVKPEEVAIWEITITPDGTGLPSGGGTAAEGEAVYNAKCAACHGVQGTKGPADPLVGGIGTLTSKKPLKTVGSYWPYATTLFDYIRRAMPYSAPESLSNDEVYALCAYLLSLNSIIEPGARMDAKTLPQVKMPNRDGFVSYWPE